MKNKINNNFNIPLRSSLIFKVALFTFTIFFLALCVYLYSTFRIFSASYDWLGDVNISESTEKYMEALKEIDRHERQSILNKLINEIDDSQKSVINFDKLEMDKLLNSIDSKKINFKGAEISQLTSEISDAQLRPSVEWLNRSKIRVLNFSAEVSHNTFEKSFLKAQDKLKKIKIFEMKMFSDLVNGLLKISGVLCVSFFLLVVLVYVKKARDFNHRIKSFFSGLQKWSRGDFTHREAIAKGDELGLIQLHFNNLATEKKLLIL